MPDDPQASLRADLLLRIGAARFELERSLATLSDSASRAAGDAGLADLAALQRSVAAAGPAELVAMRSEVSGAVAAIAARTAQLQSATASTATEAARSLDEARSAARAAATAAMEGMHDFDAQLRFASRADADAYAQRAAERRAFLAAQQAKHTPEGDLDANAAALGQMADAHAHGAGGPEFERRWNALVGTTERLRAAAKANGIPTEEFDRRLREDLRAILKSKGLSDAEIAARFAANPDPLEAVKAYVTGDAAAQIVENAARDSTKLDQGIVATDTPVPTPGTAERDPLAKLKSMGLLVADHSPEQDFSHGVAENGRLPQKAAAIR